MASGVIDIAALAKQREDRLAQERARVRADRVTLGARLRTIRLARGLTQSQVGERCAIHQPKLSDLEAGRRPLSEVQRSSLAQIYEVSLEDLTVNPLTTVLNTIETERAAASSLRLCDVESL